MIIKKIELIDRTNNKSFYDIVCAGIIIGYIKKTSKDVYIVFPELPNFKSMIVKHSLDECVTLMSNKLNEFVNIIT